jgi:hypothetical protein
VNIGIIIPALDVSQLAFNVAATINHELSTGSKHDYTIFFEHLTHRSIEPKCAVMSTSELWSFKGLLISTTLSNTRLSESILGNIRRVFLLQDLEWLRNEKDYLANVRLLKDLGLPIGVRSLSHSQAMFDYCGRKPNFIMPQLNFQGLANEIKS